MQKSFCLKFNRIIKVETKQIFNVDFKFIIIFHFDLVLGEVIASLKLMAENFII